MVEVVIVVLLAGWLASLTLDPSFRFLGAPIVIGILGMYAGTWLWDVTGWAGGPTIADLEIAPLLFGTLAVSGVLKLVALGVAGSSR